MFFFGGGRGVFFLIFCVVSSFTKRVFWVPGIFGPTASCQSTASPTSKGLGVLVLPQLPGGFPLAKRGIPKKPVGKGSLKPLKLTVSRFHI